MGWNLDLTTAAIHYSLLYLSAIVLAGLFWSFGPVRARRKRQFVFVMSAVIFVLMAFRDQYMGSDTVTYVSTFNQIAAYDNPFECIRNTSTEAGYVLYCWCLSRVVANARILFVVSAAFITWSVARFANKYVSNAGLFYCLLIGTMYFDFLLSAVRQSICIAILLFAFDALLERRRGAYFAWCAVAMLFHQSTILAFLIYPLFSKTVMERKRTYLSNLLLFSGAFLSGFFINSILQQLLTWFPKYKYYIGSELFDGEPRLAVALKFLVFLLLLIVPGVMRRQKSPLPTLTDAGNQMAMLNLIIIVIASNATALMRFSYMFGLYALMQYSNEVSRLRPRSTDKVWLTTLTLVAFYVHGLILVIFKTPDWQTTYPIQLSWWIH